MTLLLKLRISSILEVEESTNKQAQVRKPQKSTNFTEPACNNLPHRRNHFCACHPHSFLPCPCFCVHSAKSHIPPLPLPTQTPFGGPSFPAEALGITCHTCICKTNQVWKGTGCPSTNPGGKAVAVTATTAAASSLSQDPEVGLSRKLLVTEPQLSLTGTVKQQRP